MVHTIAIESEGRTIDLAFMQDMRGGPLIVCLHGLQSNSEAFAPVFGLATQHNFSAVAFDFIGFGQSSRPENFSYALESQADCIAAALDAMRVQNFWLLGHSMGGMVGTMLLERFRRQLLGFINMEGNFVLADCGASLDVAAVDFATFSRTTYPALKQSLASASEPSAASRSRWLASTSHEAFYRTSQSIVDWSRRGTLLTLYTTSPVKKLFLYGERNRRKKDVLPPGEPSEEIANAGHFMLADNPKATLAALEKFFVSSLHS